MSVARPTSRKRPQPTDSSESKKRSRAFLPPAPLVLHFEEECNEKNLQQVTRKLSRDYLESLQTVKQCLQFSTASTSGGPLKGVRTGGFVLDHLEAPVPQVIRIQNCSALSRVGHLHNWWAPQQKAALLEVPQTHASYGMAGIMTVPYRDIPLFREALREDILNQRLFFWCEWGGANKNPERKMILSLDIDMESTDQTFPEMMEELKRIEMVCQEEVARWHPRQPVIPAIACHSIPYVKRREDGPVNHVGSHIYFFMNVVTVYEFNRMRPYLVERCRSQIGPRIDGIRNKWEDVIDYRVPNNGLRLIFARKPVSCPYKPEGAAKCHVRSCDLCGSQEGLPGPSFYFPAIYYENAKVNVSKTQEIHNWSKLPSAKQQAFWDDMISKCTICPYADHKEENDWTISEYFRVPVDVKPVIKDPHPKRGSKLIKAKACLDRKVTMAMATGEGKGGKYNVVPSSSEMYTVIRKIWAHGDVSENLKPQHQTLSFNSGLSINQQLNSVTLTSSSKYCIHVGRNHSQSHIYFVISGMKKSKGVRAKSSQGEPQLFLQQRCFSPKCKNYASVPILIPTALAKELLPEVFRNRAKRGKAVSMSEHADKKAARTRPVTMCESEMKAKELVYLKPSGKAKKTLSRTARLKKKAAEKKAEETLSLSAIQ